MATRMTDPTTTDVTPMDVTTGMCLLCSGTGWADPWEVGDGSPELTSCDRCLGVGLDDCSDCDGDGAVARPIACPCQDAAAA